MRLRNIPGARETIAASEYVVHEDVMREKKGKWDTVLEKAQPLYLEVGMGKGRSESGKQLRRNRKIFERAAARTGEARAAPGADKSALSAYGCRGSAGSIR